MRRPPLRTALLGLIVTAGSSVVGIGLGTLMNRTVFAQTPAPTDQGGADQGFLVDASRFSLTKGLGAAEGLRVIHLNPRDLPNHEFNIVKPQASFNTGGGVTPVPSWTYNFTASSDLGGGSYTGTILGRSPYLRGKTTTTIPVQIVPLIIKIGTTTYDPTANDPCVTGAAAPYTDVSVITGSPIFQSTDWVMNGVDMGTTQYHDAFMRAQFWSLVGGTNYHLILNPTVLPAQTVTFTASQGTNYNAATNFGGCGFIGVVNTTTLDNKIQALITGALSSMVNVGTVPIFLTKSVVSATSGHRITANCCVLGYHGALTVGGNLQTYSPFSLDTTGVFGGDVNTLSHEIGELINDPTGNNPTPTWGNIGQTVGGCQNNFEVGDPLSEGFGTPTQPFVVNGANGLTYHMQELAFASWFYGGPSLGAGGKYSNNSSFGGDCILCSAGGGTN